MRKYLFLLAFILTTSSAFAASPPEPQYNTVEKLQVKGANQYDPYREVKLVRLSDSQPIGVSVASGDAVIWDTLSDDGVSVALTTTSGDGAFAGIACTAIQTGDTNLPANASVGTRNWGWIVTQGPAIAKVTAGGSNGHAVGNIFITSTDSGAITTLLSNTVAAVTNSGVQRAIGGHGGFFYDAAVAADTTAEVYVE